MTTLPLPTPRYAPVRPPAPEHFSAEAAALWELVTETFDFSTHEFITLRLALEAWQRAEAARVYLNENGVTYTDRFGAPRTRPEVAVERDSRAAFLKAWKLLALPADESNVFHTSLVPR